jgi:uncharacterized protein YcfJ
MNKSLLIGLIVGVGATAGVGALGLALKGAHETEPQMLAASQSPTAADEAQPGSPSQEIPASSTAALSENADAAPDTVLAPAPAPTPLVEEPVRTEPRYARVVSAVPVSRPVSEPREICKDVEVVKQAPVQDEHQIAGTVVGGVIGGVIGNQIGSGDGRKIAKIAGALGGAYAGNKVQERIQNSRTVTTVEKKCETVNESREVPDGYRVTYEWQGGTRTVHMATDPGSRLPVRGGKVILTAAR